MMNSSKRKMYFSLEDFHAQLVTKVTPVRESSSDETNYLVSVLHPNSKEVLSSKKVLAKDLKDKKAPWNELMALGEEMKNGIHVETELQKPVETPKYKKGTMKRDNVIGK